MRARFDDAARNQLERTAAELAETRSEFDLDEAGIWKQRTKLTEKERKEKEKESEEYMNRKGRKRR